MSYRSLAVTRDEGGDDDNSEVEPRVAVDAGEKDSIGIPTDDFSNIDSRLVALQSFLKTGTGLL